MKILETKTVRFTEVVSHCGTPTVHTLWQKPTADRKFQALLKSNRIMTVLPSDGGTDFGQVGFRQKTGARFLAFPKSLKRYADQRIVGIKWELIGE